jgi:hypothetical protein
MKVYLVIDRYNHDGESILSAWFTNLEASVEALHVVNEIELTDGWYVRFLWDGHSWVCRDRSIVVEELEVTGEVPSAL